MCLPVFGGRAVGRPWTGEGFGDYGKVNLLLWGYSFPSVVEFLQWTSCVQCLRPHGSLYMRSTGGLPFLWVYLALVAVHLHVLCSYPAMEGIGLKL